MIKIKFYMAALGISSLVACSQEESPKPKPPEPKKVERVIVAPDIFSDPKNVLHLPEQKLLECAEKLTTQLILERDASEVLGSNVVDMENNEDTRLYFYHFYRQVHGNPDYLSSRAIEQSMDLIRAQSLKGIGFKNDWVLSAWQDAIQNTKYCRTAYWAMKAMEEVKPTSPKQTAPK